MPKVLLVELNEVNFEFVRAYGQLGELPTLNRLADEHGLIETTSEAEYSHLEPWIQWVTAHTGMSLSEHKVFRLGDIKNHEHEQIWENLEQAGFRVGAISPMNANNRLRNPLFFVPDPWTRTHVSGGWILRGLHRALSQAVNDNASSRVEPASLAWIALALGSYVPMRRAIAYVKQSIEATYSNWRRPILLDALLTEIFVKEVRRTRPDFASLFLNAAAHLQHHYMFNASVYRGGARNPDWYLGSEIDPILAIYKSYDEAVSWILDECKPERLMIATGLHQKPHRELSVYWRPKQHEDLLQLLGVRFSDVDPLMSRDFRVICEDSVSAREAEKKLKGIRVSDGEPLFEVDNRGSDLFVSVAYTGTIGGELMMVEEGRALGSLRRHLTFVAIKNGEHDGLGYLIDTGVAGAAGRVPLSDLPSRIRSALGVAESSVRGAA